MASRAEATGHLGEGKNEANTQKTQRQEIDLIPLQILWGSVFFPPSVLIYEVSLSPISKHPSLSPTHLRFFLSSHLFPLPHLSLTQAGPVPLTVSYMTYSFNYFS